MARGLLHGAIVVLVIGLTSVVFVMFSPMWLVLRTELEEHQCWYGEGIWESRYYWGSDLLSKPCTDPKGLGPYSTTTAYCENERSVFRQDDPHYNRDMCNSTNRAKITATLATLFALTASVLCLYMGFAGTATTTWTFCARIVCQPLNRRQEFATTFLAFSSAILTIVFTFSTMIIMMSSPLFSESHRNALSKTQVGLPFTGISACSFQTPLHSVFSLADSAPMICLFPGPSFFTLLIAFICEILGAGFLLMIAKDIWLRTKLDQPVQGLGQPLLQSSLGESPRRRLSSGFEEEHDDVLPASFRKVRRYSLYGAFARRFSKLSPVPKFCLLTFLPVFFMAGNAIAWAAYSMLGIQIIVKTQLSIVSQDTLLLMEEELPSVYGNQSASVRVWDSMAPAAVDKLVTILKREVKWENHMTERLTLFTDVMNVFNFSPITSLPYFWQNEAYIIAVAVFFSVFIIPILKVVCWIWFFYAPSDEISRGRFLSGLDAIGKYALANLYVFCFLAIALCFDSEFIKIPLGNSNWLLLRIKAAVNAGNGIGSYMYVLTSIMSLLIGQYMCRIHSYASAWEEDRRARFGISYEHEDESQVPTAGSSVTFMESPNYTMGDTPYMDSGGGLASLGFTSASTVSVHSAVPPIPPTALRESGASADELVPTFKSLASFGSTADLQRIQRQSSGGGLGGAMKHGSGSKVTFAPGAKTHSAAALANTVPGGGGARAGGSQAQPEIMRALASFGSRTALNVLAARSERNREARLQDAIEEEDEEEEDESRAKRGSEDEQDDEEEGRKLQHKHHGSRTSLEEEQEEEDQRQAESGRGLAADDAMQFVDVTKHSVKSAVLADALHPFVEAMCDRVHSPMQGARIKWTPKGKIFVWVWIFLLAGFVLVCQSWDLIELHKKGIAGDFIVKPKDRFRQYSLVSFTGSVASTGYEVPAFELSTLFFIMTAVMPVLTTLGLAMMWTIPLTLDQQAGLFNWLEIASAWSSLDIFFISIVVMYIELKDITDKIISDAVPRLSELIELILPFEDGTMSADMRILDGFWVLLIAVIFEKFAIYLICEQAVTSISERRVESFLRCLARQTVDHHRKAGGSSSSGDRIDTGLLGDAAEGLLETEAMIVFAPTGRYTSAMFPRYIYAGLPRSWWLQIGVRLGLLADAKVVSRYDKTGEWFDLDQSEIQGQETSALASASTEDPDFRHADGHQNKKNTSSLLKKSDQKRKRKGDEAEIDEETLQKRVSWVRMDSEISQTGSKASFGGEDDGPLSF